MTEVFELTPDLLNNIFAGHTIDENKKRELTENLNACHKEKSDYLEMANALKGTTDSFLMQSMVRTERDINTRYEAAIKDYIHYLYGSIIDPAINAYASYIANPDINFSDSDLCVCVFDYTEETTIDKYLGKSNVDELLTFAIDDFMKYVQKKYPEYKPNTSKMFENEKTVVPGNAIVITEKPYVKLFTENENGLFSFDVGTDKYPITRIIQLDYSGLDSLNDYDRSVCDAIVTHVEAGNTYITPQMIYKIMTRNPNARLTQTMNDADDIRNSIRKLIKTTYKTDISDEARFYPRLNNMQLEIEEPIVLGRIVTAKELNGQYIDSVLQVVDEPIVLRIAKAKGQLQPVPIKLLATPVNKNRFSLRVQGYLERWIVWKHHDNNEYEKEAAKNQELPRQFPLKHRTLLLEKLMKEVLEPQPDDPAPDELRKYKERIKKQKQRLNTLIPDFLTSYCKNQFYICAYVLDNERIRIAFNSEQEQGLKKFLSDKTMSYMP